MTALPVPEGFEEIPPGGDRYAASLGPYFRRKDGERYVFGFRAEERHLNSGKVVHGGCLMSFVDEMLGITVHHAAKKRCVTISLDNEFVAGVNAGDWVEGYPEVIRVTRALVFIRGILKVGEKTVFSASGIWKVLGER